MAKRVATQVHQQASRLLRENYIKREPAWYRAVLEHPPLPLPAKAPPPRTKFDIPSDPSAVPSPTTKKSTAYNPRPLPIQYVEDELRRQFFNDHPFEAFRATSIVESAEIEAEHPIRGTDWKRLIQRGRNPSPEDAVRFAANLYEHHEMTISKAYATAVAQFRSLRSEQHLAQSYALLEAEWYGIQFGPSQVEVNFEKQEEALSTWSKHKQRTSEHDPSRKKWKAAAKREGPEVPWSSGQEYVRMWKEGIRPTYIPILTEAEVTARGLQVTGEDGNSDFMAVINRLP